MGQTCKTSPRCGYLCLLLLAISLGLTTGGVPTDSKKAPTADREKKAKGKSVVIGKCYMSGEE